MRIVLILLLSGCTATAPPLAVGDREPVCARQCLLANSSCISTAGVTNNRLITGDVLYACNVSAQQCLSTCPAK